MKRFFKNLLFGFMLCFTPIIECAAPAGAGLGIADAFKDLSEAELLKAIEESQKALVDLMENGTPEQKAEFEKALTELAENLSPEDWKELQAIGEVYEKNNPYEAPKEATKEPVAEKKPEVKATPAKVQNSQFESSMKETLDLIIKNIDHMFHVLSAHRDLNHKLKLWEEKSSFQELKSLLIRLKKHINRLSKNSDPENKIIIDNLHAFKKDLEAENKKIALAQDDFGLENPMTSEQSDHTLTRVTLVLSTGINNLLPSLTAFFKKYEPEALEEAKKKDSQKAKAKEHEKASSQRRPSSMYHSTAPSHSSRNNSYNEMPQRRHRPSDMQNGFHQQGNAKDGAQKEHKADFGGFNMNITRGTIQNGKATPNPEKKKDEKKDGDKNEDKDDSDKNKKSETKKVDVNKNFIQGISKLISENLKFSTFTRTINGLIYPILNKALPTSAVNQAIITPTLINAITSHLAEANPETLKNAILKGFVSTYMVDKSIIEKQVDTIITVIQKALVDDPAVDTETILNDDSVRIAISNTFEEINNSKIASAQASNSADNVKIITNYAKTLNSTLSQYNSEIDDITSITNLLQSAIGTAAQEELSKFIKTQTFKDFEKKVQDYDKDVQNFINTANQQQDANMQYILPADQSKYLEKHAAICALPGNIAPKITSAKNTLKSIKHSANMPYLPK